MVENDKLIINTVYYNEELKQYLNTDEPKLRQYLKHAIYLNIALVWGKLSRCKRKKVGAIIVHNDNIVSCGYNGTPAGFDNCCEEPVVGRRAGGGRVDIVSIGEVKTKPEVLHAESNAITKMAKSTTSCQNGILYSTMAPCFECAKLIIQSGIKEVFYVEDYRDNGGKDLLRQADIPCINITVDFINQIIEDHGEAVY